MKKRVIKKIGDLYVVKIDDTSKKYFQYIADDINQLNSNVIRAFNTAYPLEEEPNLSEVIQQDVAFYSHCFIRVGLKFDFWDKAGNVPEIGNLDHILFRRSSDYGDPKVDISYKWWVWKINERSQYVGELKGEARKAEDGVVMDPLSIVHRMRTGQDRDFRPLRF
jgi:hypothetical protein